MKPTDRERGWEEGRKKRKGEGKGREGGREGGKKEEKERGVGGTSEKVPPSFFLR